MPATNEKSNVKIHFFYVSLILGFTIILLLTFNWTKLDRFIDYLSTAATITSLVLALLAIIYAYISNDSLAQTIGTVTDVANDAQEATTKVSQLLNEIDVLAAGANKSNKHLDDILEELKTQMGTLAGTASTLDQKANAIAQAIPEITKGQGQLMETVNKLMEAPPKEEKTITTQHVTELEALAKDTIERSSPWGMCLMHALYLSKQTKKAFDLRKLLNNPSSSEYLYGYFVALAATGLIKFNSDDSNPTTITTTDCPSAFIECRNAINKYIEKQVITEKTSWQATLVYLEAQFAS